MNQSSAPLTVPRPTLRRRVRRWTLWTGALVLLIALAGAVWIRVQLGRSLAQLDGERQVAGLTAPVTVSRDALGVPTITGQSREDVARALGFVHAQDRFFQMDLARRRAAGELSELIGAATVKLDAQARVLGLRGHARRVIEQASVRDRALVTAYSDGVNAGLAALAAAPPEYLALRTAPVPWRPEDCALVLGSMFLQLQDAFAVRESRLGLAYEILPRALADFLTSTAGEWETPLAGPARAVPPIPGPEVIDLRGVPKAARGARPSGPAGDGRLARRIVAPSTGPAFAFVFAMDDDRDRFGIWGGDALAGSNNWAVSGAHTRSRGAIVANDMHLGHAVPNIWYRASMAWGTTPLRRVTGVTLPGVPSLVVGSNGDIAWAFTNTTADWSDIVLLDVDPADPSRYRTPGGWQPFVVRREDVAVARAPGQVFEVRDTVWGPVIEPDARGRHRAVAWVPLREGGMNLSLSGLEDARTLEDACAVAAQAGVPGQNLVVAQRDGRIAWSIAGRIPRRVGHDGQVPTSWADGTRGWDGWLTAGEYPRVIAPPTGRIVTANNRLVDGEHLRALGDGGYDPGARARQIAEGLAGLEGAAVSDMLAVQLDDRAIFLDRWRMLLLQVLSDPQAAATEERRELRQVVELTWTGRASTDSAAYRLVREFRQKTGELAFTPLFAGVRKADPAYPATAGRTGEGPLWALVSSRPPHLLSVEFASWPELLLAAADRTVVDAKQASGSLAAHTWGRFNTSRIQHPLARAVPLVSRWLDLARDELPGDSHMPRVQAPEFGASQRLAVSPGREEDGYFHMPGGQSGHPLSPHYRDGHRSWVMGTPTPFLPGPTLHTLVLRP